MNYLQKALEELLPNGGWSCGETYESIVVDEGVEKPTAHVVEVAVARCEHNQPIKQQIADIESSITPRRKLEFDFGEDGGWLQGKYDEIKALRETLL